MTNNIEPIPGQLYKLKTSLTKDRPGYHHSFLSNKQHEYTRIEEGTNLLCISSTTCHNYSEKYKINIISVYFLMPNSDIKDIKIAKDNWRSYFERIT